MIDIKTCHPSVGCWIIKDDYVHAAMIVLNDIRKQNAEHSFNRYYQSHYGFEDIDKDFEKYPRGVVQYDTVNKSFRIICSEGLSRDSDELELVTRLFHIPPAVSDELEIVTFNIYNPK